jgi:hypothetical protein
MSEPKLHHTTPQLTLRRFATKDEAIELVDRANLRNVIPTFVSAALARKHFYSVETAQGRDPWVEKFLAREIEGPAADAFRRLVDEGRSIRAPGIRTKICLFLGFQRVRGPAFREILAASLRAEEWAKLSVTPPSEIAKQARRLGEEITEEQARTRAEAARRGELPVDLGSEANLHLEKMPIFASVLAESFNARRWRLLEFDAHVLVTSDEPIVFIGDNRRALGNNGGVENAREVVFPIGARHALQMLRRDIRVEEGRFPGTPEDAQIFNLHVAYGAHRFIARYPGTDPLRGVTLPKRAEPIVFDGEKSISGILPNATRKQRARTVEKVRARAAAMERERKGAPRKG